MDEITKRTNSKIQSYEVFLNVLASLCVFPIFLAGVKSFCTATPAKEGEEALISCHFDTDINTVQKNVRVYVFKGKISIQ